MRRTRPTASVGLGLLLWATHAIGQEAEERVAVALEPDTVRVGEEFTLGVTVRAGPGERVLFPALLSLGDLFEQRGRAQVTDDEAVGRQRVHYRLVAWKSGSHYVPPFEVGLKRDGEEGVLAIEPPSVHVTTVLPADTEDLELRDTRPFLRLTGFPWWLLLLALLLLAALLYWLWRRSRRPAEAPAPALHPAEILLQRLERLRGEWVAGGLPEDLFFDRFDGALRDYAEATRDWAPGRPIRTLGNGGATLAGALRRSALVRFAGVGENRDGGVRAIEAGRAWLHEEWQPPEPAEEAA